jgi:trigger factor
MQVSVEEVSPTRRRLAIEVPVEKVTAEIDRAYGRVQQQARIRGFRPGKVPRTILEKYFGDQVRADVLSHLIEHSFAEAVDQAGLRPVGAPEIVPDSIAAGEPLRYQATIDVLPKIELGSVEGLPAKRPLRDVVDEDVDRALQEIRESLAELRPAEGRETPVKGDFVVVDYVASLDGEALGGEAGGKRENRMVEIGSGGVAPEIEEALQSMTVGESRKIPVAFPAEHPDPKIAGKTVEFDLALRGIREKILPAVDDELAREHGEAETLEALRDKIRERITASIHQASEEQVRDQVMDALLERNAFDAPKSLVDRFTESLVTDVLMRSGHGAESLRGDETAMEKLREDLRPRAERQVRAALALETLADREKLEISDADVEERIEAMAGQAGEHADRLRAAYRKEEVRDELRSRLVRERALEWLVARAAIEDVVVPPDVVAPSEPTR